MLQILEFTQGNVIATRATDKVTGEDYEKVKPMIHAITEKGQKIRWYFELQNEKGWNAEAILEDLKVDVKHASDYEKIAVVGEKKWQEMITKAFKPFTGAEVKFFEMAEKDKARSWITN